MSLSHYAFIEGHGFTIGFIAFFIVLFYAYILFTQFDLQRTILMNILLLSACGHFFGALCNYWFSITIGSDSVAYFNHTFASHGLFGYYFAMNFLNMLRRYLLDDSFLGAFFLFGALGFLGSVYFFVTYKILLDKISGREKLYFIDQKQLIYPALILLCWPSYFFWSAGLVKDSFSFLSISMFLFTVARGKKDLPGLLSLFIAFWLGFLVRPYLFIIILAATVIYILLGSKWSMMIKITILCFLGLLTFALMPILAAYNPLLASSKSVASVGDFIIRQQMNMNIGSSIPMPTHNPHLVFFFLPYLVFANLFLPLGIGASNMIGLVSSLENAYLVGCVLFFLRYRWVWKVLGDKFRLIRFFMLYFLVGISCLSLMCTNLGLAMREKILYVPAFLICFCLVFAYRRIMLMQYHQAVQENAWAPKLRLSEAPVGCHN